MKLATQTHLATLRHLLEFRLGELRGDLAAADVAAASPTDVHDRKDEAVAQSQAHVDAAQERRDLDELQQVEAALHRLDLGVYGDCDQCGEPISFERLLVQPAALRCARCQSVFEHHAAH